MTDPERALDLDLGIGARYHGQRGGDVAER
jgi:hypothetical protein